MAGGALVLSKTYDGGGGTGGSHGNHHASRNMYRIIKDETINRDQTPTPPIDARVTACRRRRSYVYVRIIHVWRSEKITL